MVLLRYFVLCTLKYNILFHAKHISGSLIAKAMPYLAYRLRNSDPLRLTQTTSRRRFRRAYNPSIGTSYDRASSLSHYGRFSEDIRESVEDFGEPGRALLPDSVNSLALFISYLSARKFAPSTILTYVSALSYVHKLGNLPDPSKNFLPFAKALNGSQ